MQLTLIMLLLLNTMVFNKMKHPMSMGMILLSQTILIAIYSGTLSKTFWFSYILFLIFIGGLLILFIYMSSLSPNEKMKFFMSFNKLMIIFMFMSLFMDNYMINQINEQSTMMNKINLMENNLIMLSKMYEMPNNFMMIMMISYLLLTLIIIVKITNLFNGPLRMKN